MSQTILIEDNQDIQAIFTLNLNTYAGTDVVHRKDANDAIALLQILPSIDLIITRSKVADEQTAQKIYQYVTSEGLEIPIIVLGEVAELENKVVMLSEPVSWEVLVKKAAKALGVTLEELNKKVKPDYAPISSKYLYDIQETPCDIYIRIKKAPGEFQFVKRIHSKDTFNISDIEKYEAQGLKEFYVPNDYHQYFVTFVTNQIIKKLERKDLPLNDRIKTTATSYDILSEQIQEIGLDDNTIQLADSSIQSVQTSIMESSKIADLLKMLFTSKISYAYQRAHLVIVMGNFLIKKTPGMTDKELKNISYAAFFSDVTLKSIKQIKVHSNQDLKEADLTPDEKLAVQNHAHNAIEVLKDYPELPSEVITIIREQHGNDNGIGFNDDPPEDLHALSKIFIIADTFVKYLLDPSRPSTKKEIIPLLYERFSKPSFVNLIKLLEQKID